MRTRFNTCCGKFLPRAGPPIEIDFSSMRCSRKERSVTCGRSDNVRLERAGKHSRKERSVTCGRSDNRRLERAGKRSRKERSVTCGRLDKSRALPRFKCVCLLCKTEKDVHHPQGSEKLLLREFFRVRILTQLTESSQHIRATFRNNSGSCTILLSK